MAGLIALVSIAACTAGPRAAAPVTDAARTPAAAARVSWVRRTYYGASLAVTLVRPAPWTPRLAPRSFHYSATLAYLANFALRPYCRSTPHSMTCDPRRAGTYPPGGVVVTVSVAGFGPGPIPKSQLLAGGTPLLIGGRRAASRPFDVGGCLGLGADYAVAYTIDDGQAAGALGLAICWRGHNPALARQVKDTALSVRIAPDPATAGRAQTEIPNRVRTTPTVTGPGRLEQDDSRSPTRPRRSGDRRCGRLSHWT